MDKYPWIIRNLALGVCFFFLLVGCDEQAETPKEPKIVSKKIIASKDKVHQAKEKDKVPPPGKPAPEISKREKPGLKPKADLAALTKPKESLAAVLKTKEEETKGQLIASISARARKKKSLPTEVYNPEGKIDPFVPLFKEEPVKKPVKTRKRTKRTPRSPIEKVDLSQLKLVAVILAPSGNRAMVVESSGKGYIVTEGTPIGIHGGKVVKILKDSIIVEEEVEDVYGKITKRQRELKLQKPLGEI